MVWMPATCPNCGSDKRSARLVCAHCQDRDWTETAIHAAREAFAREKIDLPELENRIEQALVDPPRPAWFSTRLVLR